MSTQQGSNQPIVEAHTDTHDGKPKVETHTNPKIETKDPHSNINANPNAGRPNEPAATYTGSGGASTTVSPATNAPSSVPTDLAGALEKSKSTLQQQQTNNPHIDETGRLLASGAEKVLSTTQDFLVTSGNDQRIQAFVQHLNAVGQKMGARANPQAAAQAGKPGEGEKNEAMQNLQQLGGQLPQLVRDLVVSSELRQLLVELIDTFDKLSSAFFSKVDVKSKLKSAILQSDSGENAQQQAQQHGQALQQEANQGAQHAADQMTDQEKENLIRRFREVLAKVGKQPSYKQSADSFMALYDLFRQRGGAAAAAGGAQDPELQQELSGLYAEATAILRDLIQQKDLTPLEDKSRQFYRYLDEHHDVGQYFQELRAWAKDLIDRPDAQDDRQLLEDGKRFINRGNEIFRDEQVQQLQQDISVELRDILRRFQEDPRTQNIKSGVAEMSQAFAGSPLQAISQTRLLAIPLLKEFLKEIPLPRIDGTTDSGATYTLDNMVLRGREINLDDVSVNFKFGLNDLITLVFKIRNVEGRISNVDFAYHSKGMFSWDDEGRLSCALSSPGWKLKWVVRETPNQPLQFQLAETRATISKFKIDIEKARHKTLDKMVTSLFSGLIRKRVEQQAEQSLQKQGTQITEKVNQSFSQLQNKISSTAASGTSAAASSVASGLSGSSTGGVNAPASGTSAVSSGLSGSSTGGVNAPVPGRPAPVQSASGVPVGSQGQY